MPKTDKHYYTITFTVGRAKKQMGASSPLEKEAYEKQVREKFANKEYGYKGKIDNIVVTESDKKKKPPTKLPDIAAEALKK